MYYTKNASLDIFLSSKHPQWIKKTNICIPLLDFSCFISWASLPPVEWARVTIPMGGGLVTPLENIWPCYTCGLLPPAFSWEAKINQNSGCKDYRPGRCPTLHLYRHSQKGAEMPFAWISFARQDQMWEDIFLFPLLL